MPLEALALNAVPNPSGLAIHTFRSEPGQQSNRTETVAKRPVLLLHGFASSTELNWARTGWISTLTSAGRPVIAVDLPGHGQAPALEDPAAYAPSRIRAMTRQAVLDHGVRLLRVADADSGGIDIIGYSLGSRLAWEFGAAYPDLVHRMVLGGPSAEDPLAVFDVQAAERSLQDGTPISDPLTAQLMHIAQLVPDNDLPALFRMVRAIATEPFSPAAAVPSMPLLLVAGDHDELAQSMRRLAELNTKVGRTAASTLLLPGRTHGNAVTARTFKEAALTFLDAPISAA